MKTMKTCKTGCGKMKSGGKVAAVKKMQKGGPTYRDIDYRGVGIIKSEPRKIGKGTKETETRYVYGYAGPSSAEVIKRKYNKRGDLVRTKTKKTTPEKVDKYVAENESKIEYKKGGVKKKYQDGGSMITGMPKYSNNPRTDAGRMLQKGGSFAPNRAVQASCKGGMVRDENGRCVTARKMQKGGFPDLNKDGKITKADILKGRGVIKKLGGTKKR